MEHVKYTEYYKAVVRINGKDFELGSNIRGNNICTHLQQAETSIHINQLGLTREELTQRHYRIEIFRKVDEYDVR